MPQSERVEQDLDGAGWKGLSFLFLFHLIHFIRGGGYVNSISIKKDSMQENPVLYTI
jgi:hypothetical protein